MTNINTSNNHTNHITDNRTDIHLIESEFERNNNVNVLTPPSVKRGNKSTNSKKRKATTSVEFKKEQSTRNKSKNSNVKLSSSSKQQSITSYMKKSKTFISIKGDSPPITNVRETFLSLLGQKNMLAQIGKNLKSNFNPSYSKKSNRRPERFNKEDAQPSTDLSYIYQYSRCIVEDFMCLPTN
mmetsp:Transcript_10164/g.14370  ORF Transcript_10164/g.14370 Transcript_10164/m.14370 type:complete len:183 (+) Transcript_10164:53-601(+)